jgi:dephospho-CoA kinase
VIRLGLTGSIGMGKSTAARLFAEEGAPVFDSDATVHALYAPGGAAVAPVEKAFPGVTAGGGIDRTRLSERVHDDPAAMARLEAIVHPLVAAGRDAFLAREKDAPVVVFDIPLLFEAAREDMVDAVVVVSTTPAIQRERVLARPGMTKAKLAAILARQVPDAEKRARADFVIDSGRGIEAAREQIRRILKTVTAPGWIRKPRSSTSSG